MINIFKLKQQKTWEKLDQESSQVDTIDIPPNCLKEDVVRNVLIDFLLNDIKLKNLDNTMIDCFIKKCKAV